MEAKELTKHIQRIVGKDRVLAGHSFVCENISHLISYREMDVISLKSGLLYEYEVKISRSDFLADAKKQKHHFNGTKGEIVPAWNPNYFYYACPEGLIKLEELPKNAGLIYIVNDGCVFKKKAPKYNIHIHDIAKIQKKVIDNYQQRAFLGCCLLTYKNRLIKERNLRYENEQKTSIENNTLFNPSIQ